jgi:C4-dicarboxylate-specific signal transduction histidine kinase
MCPLRTAAGPVAASPTSVPDPGDRRANGDRRDLTTALAIVAVLEAGAIGVLLVAMRRRRHAGASACRDLVEIARLTRAAATREVGRSLAGEIGTPLTSALANLGAARRLLLRDPPQLQEISAAVDEAQSAGEGVAHVLHRLGGPLPAAPCAADLLDLNEVVREGVRLVTSVRACGVVSDLSPLPGIRGDRIELLQVVLELLLNALEAACAAGRASVVIRTWAEGGEVDLSVEHDSGAGVLEPDRAGVLAPSLATESPGSGTGLSIARSIVESYGGRMSAEPPSQGARLVARRAATMRVRFERGNGVA